MGYNLIGTVVLLGQVLKKSKWRIQLKFVLHIWHTKPFNWENYNENEDYEYAMMNKLQQNTKGHQKTRKLMKMTHLSLNE